MRKDLTIYSLAILLGFVMGLFTCKTCGKEKECPPCIEPLEGGQITDSTIQRTKDSLKAPQPTPVREVKPELAKVPGRVPGSSVQVPGSQVLRIPYPVYIRESKDTCTHLYNELYQEYATRREYDIPFAFGPDSARFKGAVQGNMLWDPELVLSRAEKTYYVREKRRNELWWGAHGGYQPMDTAVWVGTSLDFLQKRGWGIRFAASANTKGQWMASGGMSWKIGKK